MAKNTHMYILVTGLKEMINNFEKAARPMGFREVGNFERTLSASYLATQSKVHEETGKLKLSGRTSSHFDGTEWTGEIAYRRHPGIFELARGDRPTANHPEGGHHFFKALEPLYKAFHENVDQVFRAAFDLNAPI